VDEPIGKFRHSTFKIHIRHVEQARVGGGGGGAGEGGT